VLLIAPDHRGIRIPFGDLPSLQRATALGRIDFWILKDPGAAEELLYPVVQKALTAWTRVNRPHYQVVRVVGEQWAPSSHALRDVFSRNNVAFGFYAVDTEEGRRLLRDYNMDADRLPAVILRDGTVLHNPTFADVAVALGGQTRPPSEVYDVAILGAGPAGLTAAVFCASEGLRTLIVEPEAIGGQAGTSPLIRNYLSFPRGLSGGELVFRAWEQTLLFGAEYLYMRQATGLAARGNERMVALGGGCEVSARTVIVAAGVAYRRLGIPASTASSGPASSTARQASKLQRWPGRRSSSSAGRTPPRRRPSTWPSSPPASRCSSAVRRWRRACPTT
jgi:thioredoxin reductase (NADPH)